MGSGIYSHPALRYIVMMNQNLLLLRRALFLLVLTFTIACSQAPQPPSETSPAKVAPSTAKPVSDVAIPRPAQSGLAKWDLVAEDLYYGIYLNGAKMGWMNSRLSSTETTIEVSTEMQAKITGMGTVSTIELVEKRSYRISDGMLTSIQFTQSSATGSVVIKGKLVANQLELSVTAGEVTSTKLVPAKETLEDLQALQKLLKAPVVNAEAKITRFDPSALQLLAVEHKVLAIEKKVFGGVEVDTIHLESKYPQMGLSELSLYDNTGTLLETKVGGFFVARLEPAEVAKKLDYQQDLLISAVVKTPEPISESDSLEAIEVVFEGFDQFEFPKSDRQSSSTNGKTTTLRLKVDSTPPEISLKTKEPKSEFTEPTPFIQSGAAQIVEAAYQTIGNAKDRWTAVQRLVPFVYTHIKDEYVASFSNAMEALTSGRGDCTEHSILFVALARAVGIPARSAVGIAYWPVGKGFGWHAWAEVKIGDRWYAVDPTWNQPIADATHIKLAEGGPAEQARIVMLLGSLKVVSVKI